MLYFCEIFLRILFGDFVIYILGICLNIFFGGSLNRSVLAALVAFSTEL